MNLFDDKNHLTQKALTSLYKGILTEPEKLACLEHMSSCAECSLKYALLIDETDCAYTPENLAPDILSLAKYEAGKRYMLRYKLRVIAATAAAVILMFSSLFSVENINRPVKEEHLHRPAISQGVDGVREKINDMFENFREIEVLNFEKTKK